MDVTFDVVGAVPPVKGEALSMLAEKHPQRERVHRLLEAAAVEMEGKAPLSGDIELEVTVSAPRGHRLPDATNMLGGIADALQARPTGANIEHLGALATVACFEDDAQIQRVRYDRSYDGEVGYHVTIRLLDR